MNRKPLVTIRIPAYNHEQFIEQAIMSAVNQTYDNIELIVIDDGSKDRTPEIAQKLAEEFGFTFIRQENVGVSETMNRLFNISNGEYILGCASDDYLDEKAVENALRVALKTDADIVCGRVKIVNNDNEITGELNHTLSKSFNKTDLILTKSIVPKQGFFYKREILEQVYPIPSEVKLEDAYTFLKIPNDVKFVSINTIIKYYRYHGLNTISDPWYMYQRKKELILNYSLEDKDHFYVLNSEFNWFNDLSSKYKKESLKYYFSAVKFIFYSHFSRKALFKFIASHLRFFNIELNKFKND